MNNISDDGELKEYEKSYFEYNKQGKILKSIEVARAVLKKQPRNFQWMLNLSYSLTHYTATDEQRSYSKEHHFEEEAVSLCEKILADCTTNSIRYSAIQLLCSAYPLINKADEAIRLTHEMPDLYSCREHLLTRIHSGEEQIKVCQELLLSSLSTMCSMIWKLSNEELLGKELSSKQRTELLNKSISLIDLILDNDKENAFWAAHKERIFERLAQIYAKDNNVEGTIKYLLLAEQNAITAI